MRHSFPKLRHWIHPALAWGWIWCGLGMVGAGGQLAAQTLVDAYYGQGATSWEVWGDQRSNALSSGFAHTMYEGGFVGREVFQEVLAEHPAMGGLGLSAGWHRTWSNEPFAKINAKGKREWALAGSFGSELLVSTLWRRELFDLVFLGNAGRIDPLTGTGVRLGVFNRLSLGLENIETRQRIELGVVQRVAGAEFGILNGSFWVSEAADSMSLSMQTYASTSLDQLPDSGGFQIQHALPAYGVGVSGSLPLSSDMWPLQFRVDFRDIGVFWEPAGGMLAVVDTGFSTTGLPAFGTGWAWEGLLEDGVPTSVDELVFSTDSALGRLLMLPSQISATLQWWPQPEWQVQAKIRGGSWMPEPQMTAGIGWIPSGRVALGVDVRTGGWGGVRPVTWVKVRVSQKRVLGIEIEDPLGWAWGAEWAQNTYGRGVRIQLERLPGERWTRYAGFNSRDLKVKSSKSS